MTTESNHTDESTSECPTCGEGFDTQRGMKVHHVRSHGERIVETTTCEACGADYEPAADSRGRFCSIQCVGDANRKQVTLECDHCEAAFDVPKSKAEQGARYCSPDCRNDAARNRVRDDCAQCGRRYAHVPSRRVDYCCADCRDEANSTRPRPDDPRMVVWLLYVYEDYNLDTTFRRQRAVLGHDDRLYKTEVRDLLVEMGVFERIHQHILTDNDGDLLGETPAGDDSWQRFYGGAADD